MTFNHRVNGRSHLFRLVERINPNRIAVGILLITLAGGVVNSAHADTELEVDYQKHRQDILALAGASDSKLSDTGLIFDHHKHRQVPCATCHQLENPNEPRRTPEIVCSLCHEIGSRANPDENCAMCHSRTDHVVGALPRASYADVKFSHEPHLKAEIACTSCHENQDQARTYEQIRFPKMADCVSCHTQRQVSTDCQTCHKYWKADVVPDFHDDLWLRHHGQFARDQFDQKKCAFCHEDKSFCQDCHLSDPPPSHTLFFLNRGHGAVARTDREMCQACHEQDACQECHNPETGVRPASHLPGFARPPYLHCVQCHFPAGEVNGCNACHTPDRISEKHQMAADELLSDSSRQFVDGLISGGQRDCMNSCHLFNTKPPTHPLGTLNNADCLRCHVNE